MRIEMLYFLYTYCKCIAIISLNANTFVDSTTLFEVPSKISLMFIQNIQPYCK